LLGLFVSSDRDRARRCLYFSVESIADVFNTVAADDIVYSESRRGDVGAEMVIIRKSNRLACSMAVAKPWQKQRQTDLSS
jgi:hypothetical protein